MHWYSLPWKSFATFSGRARRREYWTFVLVNLLIYLVLMALDVALNLFSPEAGIGLLSGIFSLLTILPNLAVSVRRLHDTGRSGWWILIGLIPCIGLVLLYFVLQDSEAGDNDYGPNPKAPALA